MTCNVDAHLQADGTGQLICCPCMMPTPSKAWVSTKDELREIRKGSVQGHRCILKARKLLVERMAWREAV